MNTLKTKNSMRISAGIILVIATCLSQTVLATEHEEACKANIQGKIAWDPTSNYEERLKMGRQKSLLFVQRHQKSQGTWRMFSPCDDRSCELRRQR